MNMIQTQHSANSKNGLKKTRKNKQSSKTTVFPLKMIKYLNGCKRFRKIGSSHPKRLTKLYVLFYNKTDNTIRIIFVLIRKKEIGVEEKKASG